MAEFNQGSIGMGQDMIKQTPDVGDYADDNVSKPEGKLFSGPQAWPSSELNAKA